MSNAFDFANIHAPLSTAFGSVTFPTVIWLYIKHPMAVTNLKCSHKKYSVMFLTIHLTAFNTNNHRQSESPN